MICAYCKKEIIESEGYVADTDENGEPIRYYHLICNAIAKKLDLELREGDNIVLKIEKGEIVVSPEEK